MPIPINLQIPTITKYATNYGVKNTLVEVVLYGINFSVNSKVYFYDQVLDPNFLNGTLIEPTFISSDKLTFSFTPSVFGNKNFIVYNNDSKLYSNIINVFIENYLGSIVTLPPNIVSATFQPRINVGTSPVVITGNRFTADTIFVLQNNQSNAYIYLQAYDGGEYDTYSRVVARTDSYMPSGTFNLYAINYFGKSAAFSVNIPYIPYVDAFTYTWTAQPDVDDDAYYTYVSNSCQSLSNIQGIGGDLYPISRYIPHLYPLSVNSTLRYKKSNIFMQLNPGGVHSFTNAFLTTLEDIGTCNGLNCIANDVFPIGAGTSKFTTAQSTIFNTQCPVEVIGLQGTGTNGATPLWDAWKLYSSPGASPAIPICGEQGELTKTFTIEFASKVVAANFDLTAQIVSATSNSMNVTIERWNHLTSTYEVVVNNVSTGSWTVGANITKTVSIPVHTSTFKYRIAMTVLTDTSLNPTHLLKTSKLY